MLHMPVTDQDLQERQVATLGERHQEEGAQRRDQVQEVLDGDPGQRQDQGARRNPADDCASNLSTTKGRKNSKANAVL